tara:strand:- start:5 stop:517 length:513 start_codon:yes stop_codon:yes gene_type:complete
MYPAGNVIRVTPTLSTDAYADNDILFLTTEIPGAVSDRGGVSNIVDISVHSKTVVELDMDIIFMEEQVDYGSINAYSSATDAVIRSSKFLGVVSFDGSQHVSGVGSGTDTTSSALFTYSNKLNAEPSGKTSFLLKASGNSTSVYFTAILRDQTPTYADGDLEFIFHIKYL